jgi:hypothetical protein
MRKFIAAPTPGAMRVPRTISRRVVGEVAEGGARGDVEERLVVGRIQDVLLRLPEAAADRRERVEEGDLVRPHGVDGVVGAPRVGVDVDGMDFVELPARHGRVEVRRRRRDLLFPHGPEERNRGQPDAAGDQRGACPPRAAAQQRGGAGEGGGAADIEGDGGEHEAIMRPASAAAAPAR